MGIHPAGRTMILTPLALAAGLALASLPGPAWLLGLALPCGLAGLFLLWFFRDPERSCTAGPGALVAAADGRVIGIDTLAHCPELGGPGQRISVFMSPFNVHVNRAAIAGEVLAVDYRPGAYLMAFHEKASELNEACLLTLRDEKGRRVALRQIAGFLARRVVCPVRPGERFERGQRYGIIKLGSRLDHFLPPAVHLRVALGDRVKAGETVIGEWHEAPAPTA
jgi:phosphatidylserine decarboxylase